MPELLEGVDFYDRPTPYQAMGLTPDAKANEIRDRFASLQRDLQEQGGTTEARAKEGERIDQAYNQLRVASSRLRVDFFLIDPQLGIKQAENIAASVEKPDTNIEGLVKPRQMKVTHAVMMSALQDFTADPGRVVGMFVRPLELDEAAGVGLPDMLVPQFDC